MTLLSRTGAGSRWPERRMCRSLRSRRELWKSRRRRRWRCGSRSGGPLDGFRAGARRSGHVCGPWLLWRSGGTRSGWRGRRRRSGSALRSLSKDRRVPVALRRGRPWRRLRRFARRRRGALASRWRRVLPRGRRNGDHAPADRTTRADSGRRDLCRIDSEDRAAIRAADVHSFSPIFRGSRIAGSSCGVARSSLRLSTV